MRRELIDIYELAIANPADADIVRAFQRARDRIAPDIIIDEIKTNDELRNTIARLEQNIKILRSALNINRK